MTRPDHCKHKFSTVERALSITEILEGIFIQLDLRTLLTSAQLVNRGWRQLIRESPQIQEALFFKPQQSRHGDEPTFNPLLREKFPSFFPNDGCTISKFSFKPLDMVQTPEKLAAYARKDASWRKMLVQQPAIQDFALTTIKNAMMGDFLKRYRLDGNVDFHGNKHEGLRMITLFEYVLFSRKLVFSSHSTVKIGWSARSGWSADEFSPPGSLEDRQAFDATLKHFRLVIYHSFVIQCSRRDSREHEDCALRRQISDAQLEAFVELGQGSAEGVLKTILEDMESKVELKL